jgi:hypothetical protein
MNEEVIAHVNREPQNVKKGAPILLASSCNNAKYILLFRCWQCVDFFGKQFFFTVDN